MSEDCSCTSPQQAWPHPTHWAFQTSPSTSSSNTNSAFSSTTKRQSSLTTPTTTMLTMSTYRRDKTYFADIKVLSMSFFQNANQMKTERDANWWHSSRRSSRFRPRQTNSRSSSSTGWSSTPTTTTRWPSPPSIGKSSRTPFSSSSPSFRLVRPSASSRLALTRRWTSRRRLWRRRTRQNFSPRSRDVTWTRLKSLTNLASNAASKWPSKLPDQAHQD